jgi:hypothetical protein
LTGVLHNGYSMGLRLAVDRQLEAMGAESDVAACLHEDVDM